MKQIVFTVIIVTFIFALPTTFTQEAKKRQKDSGYFDYSWEENYWYKGKPSIELSYGQSDISIKNIDYKPIDKGTINLKLGWHIERKTKVKNIVKYRSNFLAGTYSSNSLRLSDAGNDQPVTLGFGFGSSDGYGYKIFKNSSLILYNSASMTWTRYDKGTVIYTMEYNTVHDRFDDFNQTFRFGSTAEGGVIIPLGRMIMLQASYDRTIVFPRHMVWLHLGSAILEAGGQSLIDGFVNAIFRSSPYAAPIAAFVLKNGLSYGLYELRREKMNWPFESAEPLLLDTYKVGLKFIF